MEKVINGVDNDGVLEGEKGDSPTCYRFTRTDDPRLQKKWFLPPVKYSQLQPLFTLTVNMATHCEGGQGFEPTPHPTEREY